MRHTTPQGLVGSALAVALVVAGGSVSWADETELPVIPVELEAPLADVHDLTATDGTALEFTEVSDGPNETTVVATTEDEESVIVTTLLTQPVEPDYRDLELDADHPVEWIEGENYFEDAGSVSSTETSSFEELPDPETEDLEPLITYAVSSTSMSVALASSGRVDEVLRDGVVIGTSTDGTFADYNLTPETTYLYEIRNTDNVSDAISFPVATPALTDSAPAIAAAAAVSPLATRFVYDTFLPNRRIPWDVIQGAIGGCVGTFGDSFGGDNRGYRKPDVTAKHATMWTGRSSRTGFAVYVDWAAKKGVVEKHVGETRLYDSAGKVKKRATASENGIVVSGEAASASLYQVIVTHKVGNPLCRAGGAIRYKIYLDMWKNGAVRLNGYRHTVPQHESYALVRSASNVKRWVTMYRGDQGHLACLSGLCATQTISKTHRE